MIGRFKVAHLLGSTNGNEAKFRQVETELTKAGYICFAPVIYNKNVAEKYMDTLSDMCYAKLYACDFCVIATPDHIGESTKNRIEQARCLNKPVYVLENGHLNEFILTEDTEVKYFYYEVGVMPTDDVEDRYSLYVRTEINLFDMTELDAMNYLVDNNFITAMDARSYVYLNESNEETYNWSVRKKE